MKNENESKQTSRKPTTAESNIFTSSTSQMLRNNEETRSKILQTEDSKSAQMITFLSKRLEIPISRH
jgi:hypothetical protein